MEEIFEVILIESFEEIRESSLERWPDARRVLHERGPAQA